MIFSSNPLYNSLKIYIIIIISLIYFKPEFIYDKKTKKFKQFGIGKGCTIFSLPILSIILAVILYIIFLWIDKLNNLSTINTQLMAQLNNQYNNQMIIQVNGIDKKDKAKHLIGKKVIWLTQKKRELTGVIKREHGSNGALRVVFEHGLPGQALGTKVKIME